MLYEHREVTDGSAPSGYNYGHEAMVRLDIGCFAPPAGTLEENELARLGPSMQKRARITVASIREIRVNQYV